MSKRALRIAVGLGLLAARASAEGSDPPEVMPPRQMPPGVAQPAQQNDTPPYLRWLIEPTKTGMLVRLPIVDTDPNRGTTFGIMPILVIQDTTTAKITQIHAPSLTYNVDFSWIPTYRYYYYPQDDASLAVRASWSKFEREAFAEYQDRSAFDTPYDVFLRAWYNVDASQRFYGIGPESRKSSQVNYKQEYWQYKWALGAPLVEGSSWHVRAGQRYESSRILNGPLSGLPQISDAFPAEYSNPYQQTNETRLTLDYDTRDAIATTTRGAFFQTYAEASVRGYLSQYDYERYGMDARWFHPAASDPGKVFAIQALFEQVIGPRPPFWLLPSLGGKYTLRAYGDGRFIDRGAAVVNAEERITFYEAKVAGATTEFQFAPFAGCGTVFDSPKAAQMSDVRTVVGAAVRAVVRPQVVGSIDVGYGNEGAAVFMDINYSF